MNRFEKSLNFALNYLKSLGFVEQIWLYGSYARKSHGYFSDVDLFVVLKKEYNNRDSKLQIINNACPEDSSIPEVDVHFGLKKLELYNSSEDFVDSSEYLFIKNIKKDGILLWQQEN